MTMRRKLKRYDDGRVFLNRWGVEHGRVGGIFLHKMEAPDPGLDLHNHPWNFWSFVLWGGYDEERIIISHAVLMARLDESSSETKHRARGFLRQRNWMTWKKLALHECHRITRLHRKTSWTLVIHGPRYGDWGFYTPTGYVPSTDYDRARGYDEKG